MHLKNLSYLALIVCFPVYATEHQNPVRIGIIDVYEENEEGRRINTPDDITAQINAVRNSPEIPFAFANKVIFVNPQRKKALRFLDNDVNNALKKGQRVTVVPLLRGENKEGVLKDIHEKHIYDLFLVRMSYILSKYTNKGHMIRIRPFHEADGSWYTWGVYYKKTRVGPLLNTKKDFILAWRHVHGIITFQLGEMAVFQLNINRRPSQGKVSFENVNSLYPGDDYVDEIVVSSYNRCGVDYDEQRSFEKEFRPIYGAILPFKKPIGVAEVSTTDICGFKGAWFKELFDDLIFSFPEVKSVDFFLNYAEENNVEWGLKNESQRRAFYEGWLKLKEKRGVVSLNEPQARLRIPFEKIDYPWTIRGSALSYSGPFNDAFNPVRSKPFGEKGFVTSLYAEQGITYKTEKFGTSGLYLSGLVSDSDNPNFWWDNLVRGGVEVKQCFDIRGIADWGGACIALGKTYTNYTKDVPERLQGVTETTFRGIKINIGGSW